MGDLNIIFTEANVLVSKKLYSSWREIEDEYDDYKASLGPWDAKTVSSWLDEEYGDLAPSAEAQVEALLSSQDLVRAVSFTS
jgi:hypothetical protein